MGFDRGGFLEQRLNASGLNYRLGAKMKIASGAREGLAVGDSVSIIGVVRVEQRAAEPSHPSWQDLPEGPLYIAENENASEFETLILHESELEPAS